ncbi:MAG: hypothetical protein IJI44_05480 [Erysipelotrichaceae bacterium]|nr:hypothetical protein [Erysipelotrichaceae bacterium]
MNRKIGPLFTIIFLIMTCIVPVSANSAIKSWKGSDGNGTYVMEKDCPVICEKEELIFDIGSFPSAYFKDAEEFSAYDASVTAIYTLHNPTDSDLSVRLVFPFGKAPQYLYPFDFFTEEESGNYEILGNGQVLDKKLRYSLMTEDDFDVARDVDRLRDEYQVDVFYHKDLPVHEYVFEASGIEKNTSEFPECFLSLDTDPSLQKLILESCRSFAYDPDGHFEITIEPLDVQGTYRFYVLGEDLKQEPEWSGMFLKEEEVPGEMLLREKNELTLEELILSEKENDRISDIDWYNVCIDYLKERGNLMYDTAPFRNARNSLLRWYEYELNFNAGETLTNSVKAPIYPDINGYYEPPVYTYRYLLSPASTWADFSNLNIRVNTSYVMIDNKDFSQEEGTYRLHYDQLPEGELSFALSENASPKHSGGHVFYLVIGIMAAAAVLFLLLLSAVIRLFRRLIRK